MLERLTVLACFGLFGLCSSFAQAYDSAYFQTIVGNLKIERVTAGVAESVALARLFRADDKFLVFLQRDTKCPIGQKTTPYIKELLKKKFEGVGFFLINYQGSNQLDVVNQDRETNGFKDVPYLIDSKQELLRVLDIKTTTEVIVVDRRFKIWYRGPLNDRFTITATKDKFQPLLENTLKKLRAGQLKSEIEHQAFGCFVTFETPEDQEVSTPEVSMAEIKPLLIQKCIPCHHSAEQNGISLNSMADFKKNQRLSQLVVEKKLMPPMNISPEGKPTTVSYGMSDVERTRLLKWLKNIPSAKNGTELIVAKSPAEKDVAKFDHVLPLVEGTLIPASGPPRYRYFYLKSPFPMDKFVTRALVDVDDVRSIHHVMVRIIKRLPLPGEDPFALEVNQLGGYAPGISGYDIPNHASVLLQKNAYIMVIMHYSPYGREHKNRIRLHLNFTEDSTRQNNLFRSVTILRENLHIPKESRAQFEHEYVIPKDATLYSLLPHTHFRGASAKIELLKKNSDEKTLLLGVNTFYFYNQINYDLVTPLKLQAGDKILMHYKYDNTSDNVFNPDSTVAIKSGPMATDEMFYLALRWMEDPN